MMYRENEAGAILGRGILAEWPPNLRSDLRSRRINRRRLTQSLPYAAAATVAVAGGDRLLRGAPP